MQVIQASKTASPYKSNTSKHAYKPQNHHRTSQKYQLGYKSKRSSMHPRVCVCLHTSGRRGRRPPLAREGEHEHVPGRLPESKDRALQKPTVHRRGRRLPGGRQGRRGGLGDGELGAQDGWGDGVGNMP